jgi:hypothetical protein
MASAKSDGEVKPEYIQYMGRELGSLFNALSDEVTWLHIRWAEYTELYGTKASRIDLLNRTAPLFFKIVQDSLLEDTILHITRLTDLPSSFKKDKLTIQRLPSLIVDKTLSGEVSRLVEDALSKSASCRDWRNRHIAHKDLQLALDEGARPLEPISRESMKLGLEAIGRVLNAISEHYMKSSTAFDATPRTQGAIALLFVLDDGLKKNEERIARLKLGKYRTEDGKIRDL